MSTNGIYWSPYREYWPKDNGDIKYITRLSNISMRPDGYMMCDRLYFPFRIDSVYDWYLKLTIL